MLSKGRKSVFTIRKIRDASIIKGRQICIYYKGRYVIHSLSKGDKSVFTIRDVRNAIKGKEICIY